MYMPDSLHIVHHQQQQQQQQLKHDIFVGNLAFNTTEDQLHQTFSEIGRVIKVRMVTDVETGKPRGYVLRIKSHIDCSYSVHTSLLKLFFCFSII